MGHADPIPFRDREGTSGYTEGCGPLRRLPHGSIHRSRPEGARLSPTRPDEQRGSTGQETDRGAVHGHPERDRRRCGRRLSVSLRRGRVSAGRQRFQSPEGLGSPSGQGRGIRRGRIDRPHRRDGHARPAGAHISGLAGAGDRVRPASRTHAERRWHRDHRRGKGRGQPHRVHG